MSVRVWNKTKQEATLVSGFGSWAEVTGKPFEKVDTALSNSSTNPVQNKAVTGSLNTINAKLSELYSDGFASRNIYPSDLNWYRNNNSTWNSTTDTSTNRIQSDGFAITSGKWVVSGLPATENPYLNLYDSSKNSIGDVEYVSGNTYFNIANTSVAYARIVARGTFDSTSNATFKNANIQVEKGEVATTYSPKCLSNVEMSHTLSESAEYLQGNIFDISNVTKGKAFDIDGGDFHATETWAVGYVDVKPNTKYTITSLAIEWNEVGHVWLDSSRNFISSAKVRDTTKVNTVTSPSNAKYLGVSVCVSNTTQYDEKKIFRVNEGEKSLPYTDFALPNTTITQRLSDEFDRGYYSNNIIKTYNSFIFRSASAKYGSIIDITNDDIPFVVGQKYTISVDLTSSGSARVYWNQQCGVLDTYVFDVTSGTHRYSYTFVSKANKMTLSGALLSISGSSSGDSTVSASKLMIEKGETDGSNYHDCVPSNTTLSDELSTLGTVSTRTEVLSVPNSTQTFLTTPLTLGKGTWVVVADCNFQTSSTSGMYGVIVRNVTDSKNTEVDYTKPSSDWFNGQSIAILSLSDTKTITVGAFQKSGATTSVKATITATKVSI